MFSQIRRVSSPLQQKPTEEGIPPLNKPSLSENIPLRKLGEKGAVVKTTVTDGWAKDKTPLHWAAYKEKLEIVKKLLEAGPIEAGATK